MKRFIVLLLLYFLYSSLAYGQVHDTIPPTITLTGKDTVKVEVHKAYRDAGVKLSDNYYSDSALRSLLMMTSNVDTARTDTYQVVYSVTDPSGNGPVTVTRTVLVLDDLPPVIELKGNATITVCPCKSYTDSGYTVTDNYDSLKYINIMREGSFATFDTDTLGLFSFRYKAEDRHHNIGYSDYRYILVDFPACFEGENPCKASVSAYPKLLNLSISPNPADNRLIVADKNSTAGISAYAIADVTGRIYRRNMPVSLSNQFDIPTSELPDGLYLLTLYNTSNHSYTYKFIVRH